MKAPLFENFLVNLSEVKSWLSYERASVTKRLSSIYSWSTPTKPHNSFETHQEHYAACVPCASTYRLSTYDTGLKRKLQNLMKIYNYLGQFHPKTTKNN